MTISPLISALWLTLTMVLLGLVLIQGFVIVHVHQQLLDNEAQDLTHKRERAYS